MTSQDGARDDIVDVSPHGKVRAFAEYWQQKRGDQRFPARVEFDFPDLKPWLGHLILMDVIEAGADFRYRLIGTHITSFLNRDLTGKLVSQSDYSGARDTVMDSFRAPVRRQGPVFRSGRVVWSGDQSWHSYDSVHAPLSEDGETIDMTIGVIFFGQDGRDHPAFSGPGGEFSTHWGGS